MPSEWSHRLGRKALSEVATDTLPETILGWYRRPVARKSDGSRAQRRVGRPPIDKKVEELIVRMAKENRSRGYDRIVGAFAPEISCLRLSGRQRSPPSWHTGGAGAQADDVFGRIHWGSPCGVGRHRFLYGGGRHLVRPGDLLRALLHLSRESQD
jgi:hypothetical protein